MSASYEPWWKADRGIAHDKTFEYCKRIESEQSDLFDRFCKLEGLYDPYSPNAGDEDTERRLANVTENVVASNVDTVYAAVATNQVRARFMTDDADWSHQRRARHLEWYAEGLGKTLEVHRKCRLAFKEAAKKGTGLIKVYADRWDDVRVEHVQVEEIVVPENDTRSGGSPMQMHHVQRSVDREQLKAEYPEFADQIDAAHGRRTTNIGRGYRPMSDDKIVVIHSIRLPIGKRPKGKPKKGEKRDRSAPRYVPGREVIAIENCDLVDRPYHKPFFPYAVITWSDRSGSFYGISGAERIAGIQKALNLRNWQIQRILDQNAMLTTYVRPADGNLTVKGTKAGNIAVCKGDYPHTPNPPQVASETYQSRIQLKDSAFEEFGVSRLAAQSHKPAGLDSGAALREYRDQTTQRFAPQEQDFEQLVLDTNWLMLDVCKDLGTSAPIVSRVSRWKPRLEWSKVDMGDVRVQIAAASTLPRTPAGRHQLVIEWAQAGIVSQDDARRLMNHPDLGRAMSLYTADLESIEEQLEAILDGEEGIVPEPFDNLAMVVWRGTREYHNVRIAGAPEDILEGLRTYIVQGAFIEDQKEKAATASAAPAMPGAMPMDPMAGAMPPPGGMPMDPAAMPMSAGVPQGPAPTSALAPQAMDLMAG